MEGGERAGWMARKAVCDVLGLTSAEYDRLKVGRVKVRLVIDFAEARICVEHGRDYRVRWEVRDGAA